MCVCLIRHNGWKNEFFLINIFPFIIITYSLWVLVKISVTAHRKKNSVTVVQQFSSPCQKKKQFSSQKNRNDNSGLGQKLPL